MYHSTKKVFLMAIVTGLIVGSYPSISTPVALAAELKPIAFRYSTGLPPLHALAAETMPYFEKEIAKRTAGRVKIELYPGGQLYKHDQAVEAISMGALDMALNSFSHWAGRNPIFSFSAYYFLITNLDQWKRARDKVSQIIDPLYEAQGAKIIGYASFGLAGIISSVPIRRAEDFKGLKIRGPTAAHLEGIAGLGATPMRVSEGEQYDAIAKKAVHGGSTGYVTMESRKLYEVGKFIFGPTAWEPWVVTMNLTKWKGLPSDIQKIFLEVGKETADFSINRQEVHDVEVVERLKQKGVSFTILTSEQLDSYRKMLDPVYQNWVKQCEAKGSGAAAKTIIEIIDAAK